MGDRIAQLVIVRHEAPELVEVEALGESVRGERRLRLRPLVALPPNPQGERVDQDQARPPREEQEWRRSLLRAVPRQHKLDHGDKRERDLVGARKRVDRPDRLGLPRSGPNGSPLVRDTNQTATTSRLSRRSISSAAWGRVSARPRRTGPAKQREEDREQQYSCECSIAANSGSARRPRPARTRGNAVVQSAVVPRTARCSRPNRRLFGWDTGTSGLRRGFLPAAFASAAGAGRAK